MRCKAFTKNNSQCRRNAINNSNYCWQHQHNKLVYQRKVESELIDPLETIVSEYADIKTYLELIKYNPKKYTLEKLEKNLANSEREEESQLITNDNIYISEAKNSGDKQFGIEAKLNTLLENISSTFTLINQIFNLGTNIRDTVIQEKMFGPKTIFVKTNTGSYYIEEDILFFSEKIIKLTSLWKLFYDNIKALRDFANSEEYKYIN